MAQLVSILIPCFNAERWIAQAIESALAQTHAPREVIVVDDGSTDDSREIIARYGNRIISVLKENGGQASALNAGGAASRGEIICLLDSDDSFDAHKVERVIPHCRPGAMLYHTLRLEPGADIFPAKVGPVNFYRFARQYRFVPYIGSPTSGLVIRRELALRLMK